MAGIKKRHRKRLTVILLFLSVLVLMAGSRWFGRLLYPFPYQEVIVREANLRHLDPFLVAAVVKAESNFQPKARSVVGARGLMQIMPGTSAWIAKQLGLKSFEVEDLDEPVTNVRLGCWYLASLFKEFNGDPVRVLAAYNGGRGNVRQWLKENRWSGSKATIEQIPFDETRKYVSKVLKYQEIYRNLYKDKLVTWSD